MQFFIKLYSLLILLLSCTASASAMGLMVEPSTQQCGLPVPEQPVPPIAAAKRLPGSQAVRGSRDIAWAWLGTPTLRYPHKALGSATHAATLHVLMAGAKGELKELVYTLPFNKVFEDLTVRLADLDGDGRDEIIVVESDAVRGSATVVLGVRSGLQAKSLVELARSPYAGSTFLWLNPVGTADFDGDGKLDVASVITPHIGGTLTLYHYNPPKLEAFARAMDISNHRMGDPEQDVAVIVELPGTRPTIVVPDMSFKALHALRWVEPGQWKELADVMALPARVQRMLPAPGGACVLLADGKWLRVTLAQ
jgi:hypothetical protein